MIYGSLETSQQSINAIDIALTSNGTLYSLNKEGILSPCIYFIFKIYTNNLFR